MDRAKFWDVIEESHSRAKQRVVEAEEDIFDAYLETLEDVVRELTPDEIVSFDSHFTDCISRAACEVQGMVCTQ